MFARFGSSLRTAVPRIRFLGIREASDIFEPPYLEAMKPKVPVYEYINFQIKGYDYAILEKFQSLMHQSANKMSLDVEDAWATPPKHLEITRLKARSEIIDANYKLSIYERNIQFYNFPAHLYPLYLRLIQAALPEGVTLNVAEHDKSVDEIRYVPDTTLKELKEELDELATGREKKQKSRF